MAKLDLSGMSSKKPQSGKTLSFGKANSKDVSEEHLPEPSPESFPDFEPEPQTDDFFAEPQEPEMSAPEPQTDIPEPIQAPPQYSATTYSEEDIIEDDEEDSKKRGKGKKRKNAKRSKKDKKSNDDEQVTIDQAYKKFRAKKALVGTVIVIASLCLIGFGVYATFFQHKLTASEATSYTNAYNMQTQVQQWDTGVQGYLQANVPTLLKKSFNMSDSTVKDFTVDNIAIEKNKQLDDTTIQTNFSCDIIAGSEVSRIFCSMTLTVENGKFQRAGELEILSKESYSSDGDTVVESEYYSFDGIEKASEDENSKLKATVDNFFQLGYNLSQDVSDIYQGDAALSFEGKYIGLTSCTLYKSTNKIGFNAFIKYKIQTTSGAAFDTSAYLYVEKSSSGAYIIKSIN